MELGDCLLFVSFHYSLQKGDDEIQQRCKIAKGFLAEARSSFLCLLFLAERRNSKIPCSSLRFIAFLFLQKKCKREAMRDFNPFPFLSYLLIKRETENAEYKGFLVFRFFPYLTLQKERR